MSVGQSGALQVMLAGMPKTSRVASPADTHCYDYYYYYYIYYYDYYYYYYYYFTTTTFTFKFCHT